MSLLRDDISREIPAERTKLYTRACYEWVGAYSLTRLFMERLVAQGWEDYHLLASGQGRRLEYFAGKTVDRPDANVIWSGAFSAPSADLRFANKEWDIQKHVQLEEWKFSYGKMQLRLKPTPFRHLGVFPEQRVHWDWLQEILRNKPEVRVLNLFAYTGASTIIAAQSGAHTTHVDASKGTVFWASENARLSGLNDKSVRWIVDDVRKFLQREIKRGAKYDVILMDPPVFGRGTKGEVWRLEEGLGGLLDLAAQLFTPEPLGFLLNFYATELYPESVERLAKEKLGKSFPALGLFTVCLQEKDSENVLPTGFCIRS